MKSVRIGVTCYNSAFGQAKRSLSSSSKTNLGVIDVLPEVKEALNSKTPVVALESTIITHGMPYPSNLETALDVEDIVRKQGAVPATIGVIDGRVKVGLKREELERLAQPASPERPVVKISRRDFPFVLSKKMDGGTTVAGTVLVAEKVGIKVFVTGGIGGVHRDVETSMDISADLMEMSRSSVTVVSSGIKSILDIGRTLEYLETLGVCVVTMGDSNRFPAFYTRESGHQSPYHVKNVDEAAELISSLHTLKMNSGVLLAVPVPLEAEQIDFASMEEVISQCLRDCEEQGIKGKAVTPFVLERVSKLTKGKSLETNIALIKNNALVGSRVATKLEALLSSSEHVEHVNSMPQAVGQSSLKHVSSSKASLTSSSTQQPLVIGGSNLDCVVIATDSLKKDNALSAGSVRHMGGGVARNMAEALSRLGCHPCLLSAVGNDNIGQLLLQLTPPTVDCSRIKMEDTNSASCVVVIDNTGENVLLVGDMSIHNRLNKQYISNNFDKLKNSSIVVMDGNVPDDTMEFVINESYYHGKPVWFEPTDIVTANKAFKSEAWKKLRFTSPNFKELQEISIATGLASATSKFESMTRDEIIDASFKMAALLAEHIETVMVTLGQHGVMMVGRESATSTITGRYYSLSSDLRLDIASVSGAGDCCAAGYIRGWLTGLPESSCMSLAFASAVDSLHCFDTVPKQFTTEPQDIAKHMKLTLITS
ncbi:pseudouridine-metabolizing bifunctional protein C1861.05 [Nilaparvata lugens]|uniref:pseudouridine-metabolizing bifunctional protein C1861.05 n=1 Tax=Nilaparvata lugens TaxID=108931 RepID=UPI00193DACEB|nr:pseudouridine-metabolizing bifunctional protein C1861.05 [Nilaparvata lugens]